MATRLYFSQTPFTDIVPADNGTWDDDGPVVGPFKLTKPKSLTAIVEGGSCAWPVGNKCRDRVYVSPQLSAATGLMNGNVKMQMSARDVTGTGQPTGALEVYVVDDTGAVVATLLAGPQKYGPNTAYHGLVRNKTFADGDAITSYTPNDGDRIIVVVGHATLGVGVGATAALHFGDDSAADMPQDETDTNVWNPWIEFSDNLVFGSFITLTAADVDECQGVATATADAFYVGSIPAGSTDPCEGESVPEANATAIFILGADDVEPSGGQATATADAGSPAGEVWCGASAQARAQVGWPLAVDVGGTMVWTRSFSEPRNQVRTAKAMKGWDLCAGETHPDPLRVKIFAEGHPVPLVCECITFVAIDLHGNQVIRDRVDRVDMAKGILERDWSAAEISAPKELLGHFEVTDELGGIAEYPSHTRLQIHISDCD